MRRDEMFPREVETPEDGTVTIPLIPVLIAGIVIAFIAGFYLLGGFDSDDEIMIDVGSGEVTISEYRAIKERWKNNVDDMKCGDAQNYLKRSKDKQSLDDEDMLYLTKKVKRCTGDA